VLKRAVNVPFRKLVVLYYNSCTENYVPNSLSPYHCNGAVIRCWIFQEHDVIADPCGRAV
jgi:hypothetical protein